MKQKQSILTAVAFLLLQAALAVATALAWGDGVLVAMPMETPAPSAESAKARLTAYFLVQRISVATETGICSVPIGTEAVLVNKGKNGMKIRLSDGTELIVTAEQLTQDAALAGRLADEERRKTAVSTEITRARAQAQIAVENARREREEAAAQDYIRRAEKNDPPAPPATPRPWGLIGSALDEKPKVVATIKAPKKQKK
jgi:hypothetical protein